MRLIKLLFILTSFGVFQLTAQPSPKRYSYKLDISFKDCKNNSLSFQTKDSTSYFNENNKFEVSFELIDNLSEKESIKPTSSSKIVSLKNNLYSLLFYNNSFLLNHNFLTLYSEKAIQKSIIKIKFRRKTKEMIIYLDYVEFEKNFELKDLVITFRKGFYKVSDEQNPRLIKIDKI